MRANGQRSRPAAAVLLGLLATALAGGPAGAQPSWRVDVGASHLVVHVYAAGLLSPVLHDHRLVPTQWSGTVTFAPEQLPDVGLTIVVAADSLRDRQPALSPDDVQTVERQVRGPAVLDAERHPEIVYRADRIDIEERWAAQGMTGLRGVLRGELALRGQIRPLTVPVVAQWSGDRLRATGSAALRQTDFGIEPYRRFLGTVAVRDDLLVEFTIEAARD